MVRKSGAYQLGGTPQKLVAFSRLGISVRQASTRGDESYR